METPRPDDDARTSFEAEIRDSGVDRAPEAEAEALAASHHASGDEHAARNRRIRVTVLLALFLIVAGLASRVGRTPVHQYEHAQVSPPPVVAPTGALADVFEIGRAASVQIQARCQSRRAVPITIGTGFFIRSDGLLLSAYHVVDETNLDPGCPVEYVAVTPERNEYPLSLLAFDAFYDVALLQAEVPIEVPYVPLADRDPAPGDRIVAIGNSRGDFLAARSGRVSRLGVQAGRADFADDTIELTAALYRGDSGGPVLNVRGEAIGVVSYISFDPGGMSSGTYLPPFLRGLELPRDFAAYAVPVSAGSALVESLLAGERRDVPVIGLWWPSDFESAYVPHRSPIDLGPRPGTIVVNVEEGGPAADAGLRPLRETPVYDASGDQVGIEIEADVIVSVDGRPTRGLLDVLELVRSREVGDTVTLEVQRGNALFRVDLTLGARRAVFGNAP